MFSVSSFVTARKKADGAALSKSHFSSLSAGTEGSEMPDGFSRLWIGIFNCTAMNSTTTSA